ncbi:Mrp/NBP35 family ATP-binding protein [Novosphingobium flavum]|uniref:Iron-sulfur cluster carrier protein n=1 Tax=Novosphingobium flavum TaxID=1778672 RepID=A0A7X1FU19_9SPHN|nr:Mrp/NBP35 family ATP-binding protein [Novosphingobium flavum]MBC2666963.1 Mrp/NBP35 family ATP-binding protein [Novosphingobium flavum]
MTDPLPAPLADLLPEAVRKRLSSGRLSDGVATLVLDASGLDAAGREGLEGAVRTALAGAADVSEVRVAMTADRAVPRARRIIAVGSGKGGVGKSTLSANLAIGLLRLGLKVGLVDADIYGPSQPRLLANEGKKPEAHDSKLFPVPSPWGVPVLSMGHLVEPGRAIAWRGPMASGALGQLVDAEWGDVDVLVLDLPPGTGDVQLTMVQKHKPVGVVIVSTPQDLALIDATRAMNFFEQAHVPVIGMVENMSGYVCPHCGESSDPFGHGGAEAVAHAEEVPFLGHIPLDLSIRQDSDAGKPPAATDSPQGKAFLAIARKVAAWLEQTA